MTHSRSDKLIWGRAAQGDARSLAAPVGDQNGTGRVLQLLPDLINYPSLGAEVGDD